MKTLPKATFTLFEYLSGWLILPLWTKGGACLCNYAEFGGPTFITLPLSPSPLAAALSVAGYTQTGKKSDQQGFKSAMELVACTVIG